VKIRHLGVCDYQPVWRQMQRFTDQRTADTEDEIWFLQHLPVFTLGQAGKPSHLLDPGDIPVLQVDRGGQVTYHGPGQLIAYLLIDLRRSQLGVRALVTLMEQSVVELLARFGISAAARKQAPGVYVEARKIAALGLRVRRGCSYHGLSLNVSMDLTPFECINPCGYPGLQITQLADLGATTDLPRITMELAGILTERLGYNA